MPKSSHTASAVDFEAIAARHLAKAELAEHGALTARLLELVKALAEEFTVSELLEMNLQLERHPKAWLALQPA